MLVAIYKTEYISSSCILQIKTICDCMYRNRWSIYTYIQDGCNKEYKARVCQFARQKLLKVLWPGDCPNCTL